MVMEKFIMIMVLDFTVQKTKIWPKNGVSVRIKMVTQIDMRLNVMARLYNAPLAYDFVGKSRI